MQPPKSGDRALVTQCSLKARVEAPELRPRSRVHFTTKQEACSWKRIACVGSATSGPRTWAPQSPGTAAASALFGEDLVGSHSAQIRLLSRTAPSPGKGKRPCVPHQSRPASPRACAHRRARVSDGGGAPGAGPSRHAAPPPHGGAIFPGHGRGHRSVPGPRVGRAGGRAGGRRGARAGAGTRGGPGGLRGRLPASVPAPCSEEEA